MPLTIVVGTGRCGSTMLSQMLQMHGEVLSLSEFWSPFLVNDRYIPTGEMSGAEFWEKIAAPDPIDDGLAAAGIRRDDAYPLGRGRFDYATGVPSICRVLAYINDEPDALYDRFEAQIPSWPRRTMAGHCGALFEELATLFGRSFIVERTGGGIGLMPVLRDQFPGARFIYLHRDGADSALSMSRHPLFRLAALRSIVDAAGSVQLEEFSLPAEIRMANIEELREIITPPFDRERFLEFPLSLNFYGWTWSSMTRTGISELRNVERDRCMTLRYERLLKEPRTELTRLANFIGAPADERWLDKASAFVDSGRSGSARSRLHPSVLVELRTACAAGTRAFDLLEAEHAAAAKSVAGGAACP